MTPVGSGKKKKETAFEQLVLPEGHKNMVQCLVAQHFRDKETRVNDNEEVDVVRGKGNYLVMQLEGGCALANKSLGKGLIILLHGAPGVGKTTTAGR
jgi:flagellar biosynthesis GTPase FlhF